MVNRHTWTPKKLSLLAGMLATSLMQVIGQNPVYSVHEKTQSASVSIMALGSAIRHGFAGNRDIYLAQVQLKGHERELAKLVDSYQSNDTSIRRSLLMEHHSLQMSLIRDEDCDTTAKQFHLSLEESDVFDAATREALKQSADDSIPCFQVVHEATRLSK